MNLLSLRRLPLAALMALPFAFGSSGAQAQVDVDVDITLDGIVILNYYSQIAVTVPSSVLGTLFNCAESLSNGTACDQGATGTITATGSPSQLTASPGQVPTPPPAAVNPAAVPLVLEDVWAVRAIANAGQNVNVTVVPGAQLLTNGAASIGITAASVTPSLFAAPGLVNPTYGDVTLTLNLTNATLAGLYTSAANEDYTLDVVLN